MCIRDRADAALFRRFAERMGADKRGANKTRLAGQVARQTERAHPAAVNAKRSIGRKSVFRRLGRKRHVVVQREELHGERRIVGQHADRVVVNVQPVGGGFDGDRTGSVRDEPVQLGQRKLWAERLVEQVHALNQRARFIQGSALAEKPWNQLELGDVITVRLSRMINGVADKIQPCDAKTFFIDRVVIRCV